MEARRVSERIQKRRPDMSRMLFIVPLFAVFALAEPPLKKELPLLFEEDFEKGADRWEPTDREAWKVIDGGKQGKVFNQFVKNSKYKPPHRSPLNIALVK